ncbi:MAG: OmpA family protein, partial [Gammaproteobacteria bacterium]|nr:OmpA family protein [Gammaproteobacteria bacterium]
GLNTTEHEKHPFLAADEKTLYFSSDREGGEGGFDIWVARRTGDGWAEWTTPENLGPGVNTVEDETSVSVDASGRLAFMSAGMGDQQDIYEFGLPPRMRPAPVVLVEGQVFWLPPTKSEEHTTERGEASSGAGVPIDVAGVDIPVGGGSLRYKEQSGSSGGEGGGISGVAGFNPGNGRFQMALPVGGSYTVYFEGMAGVGVSQTIDLRGITSGGSVELDLIIAPLCSGTVLPMNSIFFEIDKSDLLPESEVELRRFAEMLGGYPSMIVEIAGHTDSTNTEEYNQTLSEARAGAVYGWLTGNGADPGRLSQRGYGETSPVASNDTEDGRQKNRRVEFRILRIDNESCRT